MDVAWNDWWQIWFGVDEVGEAPPRRKLGDTSRTVHGSVGLAWRKLKRHPYQDLRDTSRMVCGRVDLMLRRLVEGVGDAPM